MLLSRLNDISVLTPLTGRVKFLYTTEGAVVAPSLNRTMIMPYYLLDSACWEHPKIVECSEGTIHAFGHEDSILAEGDSFAELCEIISDDLPHFISLKMERYDDPAFVQEYFMISPKPFLVMFLGRNTESILQDTFELRPDLRDHRVLVITREGDTLPVPTGLQGVTVPEAIDLTLGAPSVIVCNGGTSEQLVPTLLHYIRQGDPLELITVDRGEVKKFS